MSETPPPPRELRRQRLLRAEALAETQAGALGLHQLQELGVTRSQVLAQVRARRWQRVHSQVVVTYTGPLTEATSQWAAVLEGGPSAMLDGASALIASGLRGFTWARLRVSVPRGARARRRNDAVDIRETRRWSADDLAPSGVPRTRPAIAAIRAALWARSDKQAILVVTMAVQQGLVAVETVAVELMRIRRDRRRGVIADAVLDLAGGVRSLGEGEFARECRARGLPEPTRQVLRCGRHGRYYLDVWWDDWRVCVEIDGIQHAWADHVVGDALRHNDLALEDALVLRLPLLGLRTAADEFFGQVLAALESRGYKHPSGRPAM